MTMHLPDTDAAHNQTVAPRPLYAQVRDKIARRIEAGEWEPGRLLPNEFNLARSFGVSVGTIRKAVEGLELLGMVVRKQGRGTFVTRHPNGASKHSAGVYLAASNSNNPPVISHFEAVTRTTSPKEARLLGLSSGDQVYVAKQAIEAPTGIEGTVSVMLQTLIVPARRFPGISFANEIPVGRFEQYKSEWNIVISRIRSRFAIMAPNRRLKELLDCNDDDPILQIERIAISTDEAPVEILQVDGRAEDLEFYTLAFDRA